jgi:hypothetical protein
MLAGQDAELMTGIGGRLKKLLKTGVLKIREGEHCASKYGIDGK